MIASEYDTVFSDGDLTHLMITRKGDRNKIPKHLSYPLYKLLKAFLANYDIYIGGEVHIGDYVVTAVTINSTFDLKNELVLRQLYCFTNGKVNIQLSSLLNENCAWAFDYDVADFSCTLQKHVYGTLEESTRYDTLADMIAALRKLEAAIK